MFVAFFFLFHYGVFHFVYAIFLNSPLVTGYTIIDGSAVLIGGAIFFINHFFSFIYNRKKDQESVPNIGKIMFKPYKRIIPMHLTILFGVFLGYQSKLIFFLLLKTAVDLFLHLSKHNIKLS